MKNILFVMALMLGAAAGLRAQALVTVTDTLRSPAGTALSGHIQITNNNTFTAADGTIVPKGTVASVPVTSGSFSVALVPNVGSTPDSSYRASYQLGPVQLTETWVVPAGGPASLADVRTASPPSSTEILAASQMPALTGDVNSSAGSTSTSVVQLHWGSTALSLPSGSAPADGQCLTRSGFTITGIACGNNPASAGVANWTGSAWGTPYQVGTSPNNLMQLDSTGKLPAVDGSQLTNLPGGVGGTPGGLTGDVQAKSASAFAASGITTDFAGNQTAQALAVDSLQGVPMADKEPGVDGGAKLQACIAAAVSSGTYICNALGMKGAQSSAATITGTAGVTVYAGNFTLTLATGQQFLVDDSFHWIGLGKNKTIISGNVAAGSVLASTAQYHGNNVWIVGTKIVNGASYDANAWVATFNGAQNVRLESSWFYSSTGTNGLQILGPGYYSEIRSCDFSMTGSGTQQTDFYTNTNQVNVYGGTINGGSIGADVENGDGVQFFGVDVEGQSTAGYQVGVTASTYTTAHVYGGFIQVDTGAHAANFGSESNGSVFLPARVIVGDVISLGSNTLSYSMPASGVGISAYGSGTYNSFVVAGSQFPQLDIRDLSQTAGSQDWYWLNTGGNAYLTTNGIANSVLTASRSDGTISFYQVLKSGIATGAFSIPASKSGTVYNNSGSSASYTLPSASQGLHYTFVVTNSGGITITAAAGQTVTFGANVSGGAGSISSTTVGSTVTLVAALGGGRYWQVVSETGLWSLSQSKAVAFSALSACSSSLEGQYWPVSDSTTATWGDTITGSGTNHVLAYCDGTNWTVAGK